LAINMAADDLDPQFHGIGYDDDKFPTGATLCDRFSESFEQNSVHFRELAPFYNRSAQRRASSDGDDVTAHFLCFAGDFDRGRILVKGIKEVGSLGEQLALASLTAVAYKLQPIRRPEQTATQKMKR
jgi:hypothetical protein